MSVIEQTVIHIGEPKHGIWRIHDNGMVREYRKAGRIGLKAGVDPNGNLTDVQMDIVRNNYGTRCCLFDGDLSVSCCLTVGCVNLLRVP